mmetsp:Transcript_51073/g.76536  ORF Transcript_51073/g.76536 Transcript_51073/m.76536 type:complete len:220 (-) Transcript_51073:94-753(-)
MPGIDTSPIIAILFSCGIVPLRTASFISRNDASYIEAPKLNSSSTSLRCSTKFVSAISNATDTPLTQFPNNIPQMGMTYCGSHGGFACTTIPNANIATMPTLTTIAANTHIFIPGKLYCDREAASLLANTTMKNTYPITTHQYVTPHPKIGFKINPKILSCTNVRIQPTMIGLVSSKSTYHDNIAKKTKGNVEKISCVCDMSMRPSVCNSPPKFCFSIP